MLRAYIDYPVPTFTCHLSEDCHFFHRPEAPGHRLVKINTQTVSKELQNFKDGHYRFAAQAGLDSLWLEVDFGDEDFELAVVRHVRTLLMARYSPFETAEVKVHCGR
jgi:hypothetical protein